MGAAGATEPRGARGLRVRPATEDDLEIVTALRLALMREHSASAIYGRTRHDIGARARRLYLAQLRADDQVTLLAERRGEVVGVLRCLHSAGHPLLLPAAYGYISSVYVRPAARRTGVLRALLDEATRWCRARGLTEMRLHSAAEMPVSNAAWEGLGFGVVEHLRMRRIGD
jgi:ribosomal protein S18 acetylase RimI-like enzyme